MKKVKFGVIGLGLGSKHAECILNLPRMELLAICDVSDEKLYPKRLEGYEIPIRTKNFMDIINNPEIDAVVVASPDQLHREHAIAALEAGKHVLCEKPLALTMEDCRAIVESANKSSGKFFIGQVCRYAPGFRKAKELYDKGVIGELFFIESEYAHDYSSNPPGHWRRDTKQIRYGFIGGGCHAIDLVRWFAGNPTEVSAYGNQKCLTDWPPVIDNMIAIYKLPEDVVGKVYCSIGCKRPYTMRTVIYGTKGTIICDNTSPYIQVHSLDWMPEGFTRHDEIEFIRLPVEINSHNLASELEDFVEQILEDKPETMPAEEGARTVAVGVASVESAKRSQPIKIEYI